MSVFVDVVSVSIIYRVPIPYAKGMHTLKDKE